MSDCTAEAHVFSFGPMISDATSDCDCDCGAVFLGALTGPNMGYGGDPVEEWQEWLTITGTVEAGWTAVMREPPWGWMWAEHRACLECGGSGRKHHPVQAGITVPCGCQKE